MNTEFYNKSIEQSLRELGSDIESGLTSEQAQKRLETHGPNRLRGEKKKPLLLRIFEQFKDFLVIILIIAAVISMLVGDGVKDAVIIIG
ncbi:MAG: cation-transporting P-type ATPase, partial [Oscillospiraceae bacterium]|nr:cation-transporting P-type ATPase [Oscillospiraceae bacterium]